MEHVMLHCLIVSSSIQADGKTKISITVVYPLTSELERWRGHACSKVGQLRYWCRDYKAESGIKLTLIRLKLIALGAYFPSSQAAITLHLTGADVALRCLWIYWQLHRSHSPRDGMHNNTAVFRLNVTVLLTWYLYSLVGDKTLMHILMGVRPTLSHRHQVW